MNTLEFTFLMLALGSIGGLIAGLLGVPWWVQVVIALVLALVLLFLVRPPLLRSTPQAAAIRRAATSTRCSASPGTVVVEFADGRGQVKLANGETWTSRLADGSTEARPVRRREGRRRRSIDGATAVVVPPAPNT